MPKLTKTAIELADPKPEKEYRLWDGDTDGISGFGIRVKPSGTRSFFYQYRAADGRKKRITIGRFPNLTVQEARKQAKIIAGHVAEKQDPLAERQAERQGLKDKPQTVTKLCHEYMDLARRGLILYRNKPKKASTVAIDEGRVSRHIIPLLGQKRLDSISRADVERFRDKVAAGETSTTVKTRKRGLARVTGGPGTAGRCVDLLGSIFSYAVRRGYLAENPARGVDRARGAKRVRFLVAQEYAAFAAAINALEAEGSNETALRAYRLLALTGARRAEIFGLERKEVDLPNSCFRFTDTKSGAQQRAFGRAAATVLRDALEDSEGQYVFPGKTKDSHLSDVKLFKTACERAGLEGVTPHTLRHSFSTTAGALGYAEVTVASLIGHARGSMTSRYTHAVDSVLIAAANRISSTIEGYMSGNIKAPRKANVIELNVREAK